MKNFKEDEFTLGKYKGQLIEDIDDVQYLRWVLDDGELDTTDETTEIFAENVELHLAELGG